MTARIEAQIERFAPGFRDLVLARSTRDSAAMESYDENYVGGDINGGIQDIRQLIFRPTPGLDPIRDPGPRSLPLLVIHPARRRRPRHERLSRGDVRRSVANFRLVGPAAPRSVAGLGDSVIALSPR